jgi:chromosome partitioning protein
MTASLVDVFEEYADLADGVQKRIIEIDNKPHRAKRLRAFRTREAAEFLGISDSYLRRLVTEDSSLPKGTQLGKAQRAFNLEEMNTIRQELYARTADERYAVGRRLGHGDKLQIIALANFKGGAAKTTTAVHLSQYLALRGYRVLLADLDSQASATSLFGLHPDEDIAEEETLYPFLRGDLDGLQSLVRRTYWPNLDLLPANLGLYRVEFELPVKQLRVAGFQFWRLLERGWASIDDHYDVVICDCPPSLGYLSINAIYASTALLVPAPPSMLDFASTGRFFRMMSDTLRDIAEVENGPPKQLDFIRILITKYNTTDRNHQRIAAWMMSTFADRLLDEKMAITTALDSAGNLKRTLYELEPDSGRRSHERGLEFLNRMNAEIERLIVAEWRGSTCEREQQHAA